MPLYNMAKCKCKLQTGKACPNNAKDGSVYCGRHQKCKTAKQCPSGKEMNAKTGRCIKSCAANKTRNEKGRCVNTIKTKKNLKSTYPICLKFHVVTNSESDEDNANVNAFSKEAKDLFIHAIEHIFVNDLEEFSTIKISNVKITLDKKYFIMNGTVPVKLDEEINGVKYETLTSFIEVIDDKSIWQMQFGNKENYIPDKGKQYKFKSVTYC